MKYNNFEELPIWQDARKIVNTTYELIHANDELSRDYGLQDQFKRAAISIMNNIAEGFDATSTKEFIRFLTYSIQSCSEVISMTYVLLDIYKIENHQIESFRDSLISERKQLKGFVKYLRKKDL